MVAMAQFQLALEYVEELEAGMHVRPGLNVLGQGNELGEVGIHVPVGHHVAQALEKVGRLVHAGLRQPYTVFAPMYAEHRLGFSLKKIRQIF